MPKYSTRQRKILLDFLSCHPDERLSAKQIANALTDSGISLSAVYRNLSGLESDEKITRSSRGGSRDVFYQFVDNDDCKKSIHLSCKKCGRTYHMHADAADELVNKVAQDESFSVDKTDTVLYGVCGICRKKQGECL